jgi:hypothetical protein
MLASLSNRSEHHIWLSITLFHLPYTQAFIHFFVRYSTYASTFISFAHVTFQLCMCVFKSIRPCTYPATYPLIHQHGHTPLLNPNTHPFTCAPTHPCIYLHTLSSIYTRLHTRLCPCLSIITNGKHTVTIVHTRVCPQTYTTPVVVHSL